MANKCKGKYAFIEDLDELDNVSGNFVVGNFSDTIGLVGSTRINVLKNPTLADMTEAALTFLDNDDGFFLLVEHEGTDSWGHAANEDLDGDKDSDAADQAIALAGVIRSAHELSDAVRVAKSWAASRQANDTLIVVTADHETGGLILDGDTYRFTFPNFDTGNDEHTSDPVPFSASGPGSEKLSKIIDNSDLYDILKRKASEPKPDQPISFQHGVRGYQGTRDTYIAQDTPNTSRANSRSIEWDTNDPQGSGKDKCALLRFDALFASRGGPIPDGATIESATLTYTVSNKGDVANLHEILDGWNENVTYNQFGGCMTSNNVGDDIGTANGNSVGSKTVDVAESVQRWADDPDDNFGWIFLPTNGDGVDVRSSEFGTTASRPRLEVTFAKTKTPTDHEFQNGRQGYNGTRDTYIAEDTPNTSRANSRSIEWDTNDPQGSGRDKCALIRFDALFASRGGPIPDGATIESATLTYTVSNKGDVANLHEILDGWNENVTYKQFGGCMTSNWIGDDIDTANGSTVGSKTVDVTESVQRWADDPDDNFGWIFLPTNGDGVDVRSSEFGTTADRPRLSVTVTQE